jgi:hypothetical protein
MVDASCYGHKGKLSLAEYVLWELALNIGADFAQLCDDDTQAQREALLQFAAHYYDREAGSDAPNVERLAQTQESTIVPVDLTDSEYYTSLLRKTILYADTTILVPPVDVRIENLSREGEYRGDIANISHLNASHQDLVRRGACVFLPRTVTEYWDGSCGDDPALTVYRSPLVQSAGVVNHLPLSAQPVLPGTRDFFIYKHLLLPYFPRASLVDVARISQEETDSFARFNHFLRRRLAEISGCESAARVEDIISEIEDEVAKLRIEAHRVAAGAMKSRFSWGLFSVSLSALLLGGSPVLASISGVLGSVSLFEILKEFVGSRQERVSLTASPFYVPYLLFGDDSKS